MGGWGKPCMCEERQKPREAREWVVILRKCRYDLKKTKKMPSPYSTVQCLMCGRIWSTNQLIVDPYRDPRGPIRWVQLNRKEGRWTDTPED